MSVRVFAQIVTVCVFLCMYACVCMSVCVLACMSFIVCVCVCVCVMNMCMRVHWCVQLYLCMLVCRFVGMFMNVCVCECVSAKKKIYIYILKGTHERIHFLPRQNTIFRNSKSQTNPAVYFKELDLCVGSFCCDSTTETRCLHTN